MQYAWRSGFGTSSDVFQVKLYGSMEEVGYTEVITSGSFGHLTSVDTLNMPARSCKARLTDGDESCDATLILSPRSLSEIEAREKAYGGLQLYKEVSKYAWSSDVHHTIGFWKDGAYKTVNVLSVKER